MEPELVKRIRILDGKSFESEEVSGKWMEDEEVMEVIRKDMVFYDESGGGVTFSGGEPLMQPVFLERMLSLCKTWNISTALDTCGFAPAEVMEKMIGKVDLFLYDLKLMDEEEHVKYTGVSNVRVLQNLMTLAGEGCNVRIRLPLIPGITDTDENLTMIKDFLSGLPGITTIDLLPYHDIARNKYKRLDMPYKLPETGQMTGERLEDIRRQFSELHFETNIGG
jgi:pyruvate formate lyase activating enzyme